MVLAEELTNEKILGLNTAEAAYVLGILDQIQSAYLEDVSTRRVSVVGMTADEINGDNDHSFTIHNEVHFEPLKPQIWVTDADGNIVRFLLEDEDYEIRGNTVAPGSSGERYASLIFFKLKKVETKGASVHISYSPKLGDAGNAVVVIPLDEEIGVTYELAEIVGAKEESDFPKLLTLKSLHKRIDREHVNFLIAELDFLNTNVLKLILMFNSWLQEKGSTIETADLEKGVVETKGEDGWPQYMSVARLIDIVRTDVMRIREINQLFSDSGHDDFVEGRALPQAEKLLIKIDKRSSQSE